MTREELIKNAPEFMKTWGVSSWTLFDLMADFTLEQIAKERAEIVNRMLGIDETTVNYRDYAREVRKLVEELEDNGHQNR